MKGNQGTLHDDVRRYPDDPASPTTTMKPTVDGDHGRIETRTATIATTIDWWQADHRWPGLKAIGKVVRCRETEAKSTTETACYGLSSALSPHRLNAVVRSHWGVENRLRLNVVMTKIRTERAWATAPTTSPFCATWPSTSCRRTRQKDRSAANSNAPDGMKPICQAFSLSVEMRSPRQHSAFDMHMDMLVAICGAVPLTGRTARRPAPPEAMWI